MRTPPIRTFEEWRDLARALAERDVPPTEIEWIDGWSSQPSLLFEGVERKGVAGEGDGVEDSASDGPTQLLATPPARREKLVVPPPFLELCRYVACHREEGRWALLYRLLFRIAKGERHLLELHSDDDVRRAVMMEKAVRRDAHKMEAFVRFVEIPAGRIPSEQDDPARGVQRSSTETETRTEPQYVAWHRPDHRPLRLTAPFFAERFSSMRWTILTPDESAAWDGSRILFGGGVPRSVYHEEWAPQDDELANLWLTYYGSIFNPARIKLQAMRKEMPTRHWPTLPETRILPELLAAAPARVEAMMSKLKGWPTTAADFLPQKITLPALKKASKGCEGCPLFEPATQTVFGEGPEDARIVLVGEQPGDEEDKQGRPFIGPAGRLLSEALEEAGVDRERIYITNAVKHFKFLLRGKRRMHQNPNRSEVVACRAWLEKEVEVVQPDVLVCLGATAANSVLGPAFRVTRSRGQLFSSELCPQTVATYHPSAILRMPDREAAAVRREELVTDLRYAASLVS
ncbi:MAG TPA: UdgX family uracil-DNA binding protein [Pirellulaceae bacterium]|jgi:DNA polymerase|nr:UdgX family uracil-DNA binding protein [Pirellulaceae bacterium]